MQIYWLVIIDLLLFSVTGVADVSDQADARRRGWPDEAADPKVLAQGTVEEARGHASLNDFLISRRNKWINFIFINVSVHQFVIYSVIYYTFFFIIIIIFYFKIPFFC